MYIKLNLKKGRIINTISPTSWASKLEKNKENKVENKQTKLDKCNISKQSQRNLTLLFAPNALNRTNKHQLPLLFKSTKCNTNNTKSCIIFKQNERKQSDTTKNETTANSPTHTQIHHTHTHTHTHRQIDTHQK